MPQNRISKRKNNRYVYQYTDDSGKRHTLNSFAGERRIDFARRCEDAEETIRPSIDMTFGELFRKWQREYQQVNCGAADIATVEYYYKKDIEKLFGHRPIDQIQRADINDLILDCYGRGYARSTLSKVKACFTRPFNYAVSDLDLRIYNPAERLRLPKNTDLDENEGLRFIPTEDRERFFAAAGGSWYYLGYLLLLNTGIRPSELLGLRWGDVVRNSIYIRRAITHYGLGKLKTRAAHRAIPLTYTTIDILWQQHTKLQEAGLRTRRTDYVFPGEKGEEPTMNALRHSFERARKQTRVWKKIGRKYHGELIRERVDFSLYDFRHTFATLAAGRMAPKQLQYIMGHSRIEVTLQIYAGLTSEQLGEARVIMDDLSFETASAF